MTERKFGRGQMEWALWRAFLAARRRGNEAPIPQIFRTRIKRLLEIDRDPTLVEGAEKPPKAAYAFAPPADSSGESNYTLADSFCLAVALDLLDAGFKQREIVFLMRYLRPELEARAPDLLKRPSLWSRQPVRRDARTFLVLSQVEMTELYPALAKRRGNHPIFLEPVFCDGLAALSQHLGALMPLQRRVAAVLEVAGAAQAVAAALKQAPPIRRGRPKA